MLMDYRTINHLQSNPFKDDNRKWNNQIISNLIRGNPPNLLYLRSIMPAFRMARRSEKENAILNSLDEADL